VEVLGGEAVLAPSVEQVERLEGGAEPGAQRRESREGLRDAAGEGGKVWRGRGGGRGEQGRERLKVGYVGSGKDRMELVLEGEEVLLAGLEFLLPEFYLLDSLFDLPVDHSLADLLPPLPLPHPVRHRAPLTPVGATTQLAADDHFIGVPVA
jgi:hypothetical protein